MERILLLGDSDELVMAIRATLTGLPQGQIQVIEHASGQKGEEPAFDLLIVLCSSCSEPLVLIHRAGLVHLIGRVPLLVISEREFEDCQPGSIYHLDYPCTAQMLQDRVFSILSSTR